RTAATTAATSVDGSIAKVDDPVVKKRFPLSRIAWITYKGPIATGTGASGTLSTDAEILKIITSYRAAGFTDDFLKKGTSTNIQNAFGLTWDATNKRWNYRFGSTKISTLATIAAQPREADFFELLKAAATVGA